MATTPLLIFSSRTDGKTWRLALQGGDGPVIHTLDVEPDATPQDVAARVLEQLAELEVRSRRLVLALPGDVCLAASCYIGDLPRQQRRQAMVYRLEEALPIEAEALAVDFAPAPRSQRDHVLGVAAERERLSPLLEAFEEEGLAIDAVGPLALLALQEVAGDLDKQDVHLLAWRHDGQCDLMELHDGVPVRWEWLPADQHVVDRRIAMLQADQTQPLNVTTYDDDAETPDADQEQVSMPIAALRTVEQMQRGKLVPWIELARDAAASADPLRHVRRAINIAVAACILLALCMSGGMIHRARQYQQLERHYEAQQVALFRQTFPTQRVPASVRSRLAAEQRTLQGISGVSQNNDAADQIQPSALETLYQLLSRLPGDLRYRVLEIRLEGRQVLIEGESRSHADADRIAASLRDGQGFELQAPKTQQLQEKGVAFTLTGRMLPIAPLPSPDEQPQTAREEVEQAPRGPRQNEPDGAAALAREDRR